MLNRIPSYSIQHLNRQRILFSGWTYPSAKDPDIHDKVGWQEYAEGDVHENGPEEFEAMLGSEEVEGLEMLEEYLVDGGVRTGVIDDRHDG